MGIKAVNALSTRFDITAFRDGQMKAVYFSEGNLLREEEGETSEKNGTYVVFEPDAGVFGNYRFIEDSYNFV